MKLEEKFISKTVVTDVEFRKHIDKLINLFYPNIFKLLFQGDRETNSILEKYISFNGYREFQWVPNNRSSITKCLATFERQICIPSGIYQ